MGLVCIGDEPLATIEHPRACVGAVLVAPAHSYPTGAVLGALFVTFTVKLIELVQGIDAVKALQHANPWLDLNALRMVIYAAVLIALMILRPEGLLGERELLGRGRQVAS